MIHIEGLDELQAGLKRIDSDVKRRIAGGPLREAAEAVAQEANRRVHSPRGHARTFKVHVHPTSAYVSPGSRANFFSQRFRPILHASVDATHSRVENVLRGAVDAAVRMVFR